MTEWFVFHKASLQYLRGFTPEPPRADPGAATGTENPHDAPWNSPVSFFLSFLLSFFFLSFLLEEVYGRGRRRLMFGCFCFVGRESRENDSSRDREV